MMKKMAVLAGAVTLSVLATVSQAATLSISGSIDTATGAFAGLAPVGTTVMGALDWDAGALLGGIVELGVSAGTNQCFTTDATGSSGSIGSSSCAASSAVSPVLATGETGYVDGPGGATFQQAGTTFDGTSGLLSTLVYSDLLTATFAVDYIFNGDGTGDFFAYSSIFGSASGAFEVSAVPLPAAAWLLISALGGLVVAKRRQLKA